MNIVYLNIYFFGVVELILLVEVFFLEVFEVIYVILGL